MKTLPDRSQVETYDSILRLHVPSRRVDVAPYLVALDSFAGNGECQCEHFTCRLEPLLRRGITPEIAFESGLAEIPPWGTVEDCLRCYHVHVGRLKFADEWIKVIGDRQQTEGEQGP